MSSEDSRTEIRSPAFLEASLRSERLRIVALLSVVALLLAFATARALLADTASQLPELLRFYVLLGGLLAYEAWILVFISRRVQKQQQPAHRVWLVNVIIETSVPTAVLILLTETEFMGPYRALSAPAVLTYFFFILLSVLRLNPMLSGVTGLVSGFGYGIATVYTRVRYPEVPVEAYSLPVYVTFGAFLLFGGLTAAGVAHRVRTHVLAALREAETRHRMEQIERDLNIARSIQQGLLPRSPPAADGFDITGWSQPADKTGGDYFDWQELSDGRIAISLADVSGHGIGPALVTAVCRAYARAAFATGESLGVLMRRINELLVADLPAERFVTFVVALLDPKAATVGLLSAGHGPLLLYSHGRNVVETFDAHDIPFGVSSGVPYGPEQVLSLEQGDVLMLITDGFFEWANVNGEQFGIDRLKEAMLRVCERSAGEIISGVYESVRQFVGSAKQEDDVTAVVIKRSG